MDSLPTRMPLAHTPVDMDDLLSRCLGRMSIAERILQRFQTALDDEIGKLQIALDREDLDQIGQIAHRIKGAALAVSAYDVSEVASQMEKQAGASELTQLQSSFALLHESRRLFHEFLPTTHTPEQPTK